MPMKGGDLHATTMTAGTHPQCSIKVPLPILLLCSALLGLATTETFSSADSHNVRQRIGHGTHIS